MESISEDELLHFLAAEGGKARNSELLNRYRDFIQHGDPQLRAQHRETFKDIINKVAVVKQEAGEKYVILKKKYQHLISSMENTSTSVRPIMPEHPMGMGLLDNQLPDTETKRIISMLEEGSCGSQDGETARNASGSVLHAPPEIHVTDCCLSQVDSSAQACCKVTWDNLTELPVDSPASFEDTKNEIPKGRLEAPTESEEDEADHNSKDEHEHDASEDGGGSMGSTAIALDPIEKEWLQGAASGNVPALSHLLKQEPALAGKKDFTSGFTALHWAAKHGKKDMTVLLVKAGADVNIRAHGGYTPLHIAALHGHRDIMELLILDYGAKQTVRDYSGHLPAQYLKLEGHNDGSIGSPQFQQLRGERRNRKLACLFLPKKRWGSAEDLTEEGEKGNGSSQHLALPAPYRVRKFSR